MAHCGFLVFSLVVIFVTSSFAQAQDQTDSKSTKDDQKTTREILNQLDYPELQVVPRATDRLKQEAIDEPKTKYFNYWPFQISALATIAASTQLSSNYKADIDASEKQDAELAIRNAQIIGGVWLAGSIVLSLQEPYRDSYVQFAKIKGNSKRQQLHRERIAEEGMQKPASLVKKLKYFSVLTNLAANIMMIQYGNEDGSAYAAIAGLVSFTPLLFPHIHERVWDKHQEYKRKIYAPLASMGLKTIKVSHLNATQTTPMVLLKWEMQ